MGRRAQQLDEMRVRITEAALRLHTSIGPAGTSLVGIAEAAGVTRATLYRHFASAEDLFTACMDHWIRQHPPPSAAAWLGIADVDERVRTALHDLYAWYAKEDGDLYPIYRDSSFTPASNQAARRAIPQGIATALLTGVPMTPDVRTLRAALVHFAAYPTWRSLTVDAGLSTDDAAGMAATCISSLTRP